MPTYKNAPITEALIDIKVTLPDSTKLPQLRSLGDKIGNEYPEIKGRKMWQFQVNSEKAVANETGQNGFLFTSKDQKYVAQSRTDGFTLSRLKPYEDWETFLKEFKKVWSFYKEIASPVEINRIAVRYINLIELPEKRFEIKDYFTCVPEVPTDLPQTILDFFTRNTIFYPENQVKVIASLASANSGSKDKAAFLLDIDAFKETIVDVNSNALFEQLEKLRDIKDSVFEKYLTEKTKANFL